MLSQRTSGGYNGDGGQGLLFGLRQGHLCILTLLKNVSAFLKVFKNLRNARQQNERKWIRFRKRFESVFFLRRVPLERVKHIQSIMEIMSSTSEENNTSLIGCAGIF